MSEVNQETKEPALPWERQPGESDKAYAAFCRYRGLPPAKRSIYAASLDGEEEGSEKVSKGQRIAPTYHLRWSARYHWPERAKSWDDHLDQINREAQEKARREMGERHATLAVQMQEKLLARLKELDPADLSPGDVAKWLDAAVKVERLSRGEPTDIQTVTGTLNHHHDVYQQNRAAILASPQTAAAASLLAAAISNARSAGGTGEHTSGFGETRLGTPVADPKAPGTAKP